MDKSVTSLGHYLWRIENRLSDALAQIKTLFERYDHIKKVAEQHGDLGDQILKLREEIAEVKQGLYHGDAVLSTKSVKKELPEVPFLALTVDCPRCVTRNVFDISMASLEDGSLFTIAYDTDRGTVFECRVCAEKVHISGNLELAYCTFI